MSAKIKHLAIISDNYSLLSRFYQALFGMKTSKSPRPESAVAIGDGYIGMNIIPQKLGRQAGLEQDRCRGQACACPSHARDDGHAACAAHKVAGRGAAQFARGGAARGGVTVQSPKSKVENHGSTPQLDRDHDSCRGRRCPLGARESAGDGAGTEGASR